MSEALQSTRPMVLVLAAGQARRFGSDKRKTPINKGSKLISASVVCYRRLGLRTVVCLSSIATDGDLAAELRADGTEILHCENSIQGMGATLAEGIAACHGHPGVFVALGDMPAVQGSTLVQLEDCLQSDKIVFPRYDDRRGHPVLFGSTFFSALRALGGDRGASRVIADHPQSVHAVDVDDPGVLMDVDTQADLRSVEDLLQMRSSSGVSG